MSRDNSRRIALSEKPVRQLIKAVPHRSTGGIYIEGITPYPAEYESWIERQAIMTLALCCDVINIKSQPRKEEYADEDGVLHQYIPDFEVCTDSQNLLLEIKSLSSLFYQKAFSKYISIAKGLKQKRQSFAFLTDIQLCQQPLVANVDLLFRYVTTKPEECKIKLTINALQIKPQTINQICEKTGLIPVDVLVLLANKIIHFDWQEPLSQKSLVSLVNQPFWGLKLEQILRAGRYGRFLAELALGRRPADQSVLETAKTGRRNRHNLSPSNFVGGFLPEAPLRDLGKEESPTGKSWERRHRAPGSTNQQKRT